MRGDGCLMGYLLLIPISLFADENGQTGRRSAPASPQSTDLRNSPHMILFEAYDQDNWNLFVINANGSDRHNLTRTRDVHEMYPQASPDGRHICFLQDIQQDGQTTRSVYYMNADGNERTLVADRARQPCWSPDGSRIAFVAQEFKRFNIDDYASKGLYFYDLRTATTTEHVNKKIHHLYGLTWSADAEWIVSTVHGGMGFGHAILAIPLAGNKVHDLKIRGCRPCLSPDGRKITWSRNDHTICVADIMLRSNAASVSNVVVVHQEKNLHLYHPDFSPDGRYVSFSVGPGGRVRRNGPGTHTQVAEMVGVRGKWDLFVKRADGSGPAVQLTHDAGMSNKESEWIRGTFTTSDP